MNLRDAFAAQLSSATPEGVDKIAQLLENRYKKVTEGKMSEDWYREQERWLNSKVELKLLYFMLCENDGCEIRSCWEDEIEDINSKYNEYVLVMNERSPVLPILYQPEFLKRRNHEKPNS